MDIPGLRTRAETWFRYIEQLATTLDGGRAILSVHFPELLYDPPSHPMVAKARLAVDRVLDVVERRRAFPPGRPYLRRGELWHSLRLEYYTACAEIREVQTKLGLSAKFMWDDVTHLPTMTLATSANRLNEGQHGVLEEAQTKLDVISDKLLKVVADMFVIEPLTLEAVASSSQASETNRSWRVTMD
jgi:hypothetical protein